MLVEDGYFTKWIEAYMCPMANSEVGTVADIFVHHFVSHFGVPDFAMPIRAITLNLPC